LWAEWAAYERGYTLNNTHAAIRPILEEGAVNFYGCVGQMEKRRQRTQVTNLEYVDESARFNANSDSFIHQISYQPNRLHNEQTLFWHFCRWTNFLCSSKQTSFCLGAKFLMKKLIYW
jgi:hypothetical protein